MRGFGVVLLVAGTVAAIGMLWLLAQLPRASAAQDGLGGGVRSIIWIGGATSALTFGCLIGGVILLFGKR